MVRHSRLVQRSPVFYGWIILAVGILGLAMTSPGQTDVMSVFIEHFIIDLGISRSLVSTLYTVATLISSFALPLVGSAIDRRGYRAMVGVIVVLFALACAWMSQVRTALMLGVGFVAMRMLGRGSLELVSRNLINQWWVRRRGVILGLASVVAGPLAGAFPNLIHALIASSGWRATYLVLGGILLAVMLPAGLIFFRDRPEDYGLLPDGARSEDDASWSGGETGVGLAAHKEGNWTSAQAIRTPIFWVLALGGACISMLTTGLLFHMVSIFGDSGLSAQAAAAVFVPISITGAVAALGAGLLVNRVPLRLMLALSLLLQIVSLVMGPRLSGVPMALAYGAILGLTSGLMRTVTGVAWAHYFGRQHLGAIAGLAATIGQAGSALGPMPLGIARDLMGRYDTALLVSAALPLALAVACLVVRAPQRSA